MPADLNDARMIEITDLDRGQEWVVAEAARIALRHGLQLGPVTWHRSAQDFSIGRRSLELSWPGVTISQSFRDRTLEDLCQSIGHRARITTALEILIPGPLELTDRRGASVL